MIFVSSSLSSIGKSITNRFTPSKHATTSDSHLASSDKSPTLSSQPPHEELPKDVERATDYMITTSLASKQTKTILREIKAGNYTSIDYRTIEGKINLDSMVEELNHLSGTVPNSTKDKGTSGRLSYIGSGQPEEKRFSRLVREFLIQPYVDGSHIIKDESSIEEKIISTVDSSVPKPPPAKLVDVRKMTRHLAV